MAQFKKVDALPGWEGAQPDYYAIQEAVKTSELNGYRKTANTKRVSELSFSGAKVHPQKGLGRARQGERGNPHMYHGAKMFGPKPRNPRRKINKQQSKRARISALLHHAGDGSLWINTDEELAEVKKTRVLDGLFQQGDFEGKLLIFCQRDDTVSRAARNHPRITCLPVDRLNTEDLANHDSVIFTAGAWESLDFLFAIEPDAEEAVEEADEIEHDTEVDEEATAEAAVAEKEAAAEEALEAAAEETAESEEDEVEDAAENEAQSEEDQAEQEDAADESEDSATGEDEDR